MKAVQQALAPLMPDVPVMAGVWRATSESQKNALLKSVIDRIIFYRATGGIDVFFYA